MNLNFWSALFGLTGTLLIFLFGLPPKIDQDGHINLILEQEDKGEKNKAKKYKITSYFGLSLIAISYFLLLINQF